MLLQKLNLLEDVWLELPLPCARGKLRDGMAHVREGRDGRIRWSQRTKCCGPSKLSEIKMLLLVIVLLERMSTQRKNT